MKRFKAQQVYVSFILLIFGVLLIAGCGGSDEAALITAQHDYVHPGECTEAGPKVTSSNPTDGAEGVTVSTISVANGGKLITVNFSEAMDPTTIVVTNSGNPEVLTFTLRDNNKITNVEGTVAMSLSNTVATFTTKEPLSGDSWYTATVTDYAKNTGGTSLGCSYRWSFKTGASATTGHAPVNHGTAGNFVILAKTGISTIGTTQITGDIGLSPAAATFITGFGLILDVTNTFSTSSLVTGKVYASDYAVPTPAKMTAAVSDMETAYTDAAGRTLPDYTELNAGDVTGLILVPGLYKWSTGVLISDGGVTLSGGANDVWIFQIAGNLTVANTAIVTLSGGAQAKNIFWQVAGQTTLGTTSQFKGIILCQTLIAEQNSATLTGRALAQSAVTLDATAITAP